jgi:putative nucleotidyltransferase with HDIG domain
MVEMKRIGEELVWAGLVTREQLAEASKVQKEQGGKLVHILMNMGYLDEDTFLGFLARQSGVPTIDIASYDIHQEIVDIVPAEFAREHEVFPIDKLGKLLTLAMVCPLDRVTLDELGEMTSLRIKPILCSAADVREAIETHYTKAEAAPKQAEVEVEQIEEEVTPAPEPAPEPAQAAVVSGPFKLAGVSEIVKGIDYLPALPAILEQMRQAMRDPLSSAEDVARILSADPASVSKLLQVANSAAYGFSRRIGNIKHAVTLLGLRETCQIALSVRALDLFPQNKDFDYEGYRKHSSQCAFAARLIAQQAGAADKTGIFTGGLLHDIGKLVLVDVMAKRYARILGRIEQENQESTIIEEEELGVSHAEVGFLLAENWQFPQEISEAIRFHHKQDFSQDAPVFTAIIAFADRIVNGVAAGEDAFALVSKHRQILSALQLSSESTINVMQAVQHYAERSEDVAVI